MARLMRFLLAPVRLLLELAASRRCVSCGEPLNGGNHVDCAVEPIGPR